MPAFPSLILTRECVFCAALSEYSSSGTCLASCTRGGSAGSLPEAGAVLRRLLPAAHLPRKGAGLRTCREGRRTWGYPKEACWTQWFPLCALHAALSLHPFKCHWPWLITCHTPFYWYDPLRVQNSEKSWPTVCSATVFQDQGNSTSVCLEKHKYASE